MIHLDLFSGIGGFALAAQQVWGDEYECVGFCEIDKYCQQLLKLRFPKVRVYEDVRTISRERLVADSDRDRCAGWDTKINTAEREQQTQCRAEGCSIDLLTGGFPCQPFSQAGKRKGTADNRHLWPEMLRVIRDFHPAWVIAENVRGILTIEGGLVFEQVCLDLEVSGYEVQTYIIPACAVNAPHRRDRVWFCAHAIGNEYRADRGAIRKEESISSECGEKVGSGRISGASSNAPDTEGVNRHAECLNVEGVRKQQDGQEQDRLCDRERQMWQQNWLEVATQLCGVDDGIPTELDGFKLSKSQHRVSRLKALGNAIVPQVAIEIMKGIKYADHKV